jgi:hypothetical protein
MEAVVLPDNILKDIQETGWSPVAVRKHMLAKVGQVYILSLSKDRDMNWDPKDFSRFSWVYDNHPLNDNGTGHYKLKITF